MLCLAKLGNMVLVLCYIIFHNRKLVGLNEGNAFSAFQRSVHIKILMGLKMRNLTVQFWEVCLCAGTSIPKGFGAWIAKITEKSSLLVISTQELPFNIITMPIFR